MRCVLITGGTGSFGKSFAKAMLAQGSTRVCIYSRDEYKQAVMAQNLNHENLRFFIGDVRDMSRLRRAMQGVDAVIHAAALKRIEVGHYNPDEMVKTNILGTMNVIEAAHDAGVSSVVYLSTDKAFQPVSAYGQSKALAESLVLAANNVYGWRGPRFNVTRYGNVSGSNGSVIPKWRARKAADIKATVTDPDCTRFWMTMDQAVELVMKTMLLQTGGHLMIPELPAYRVGDLAEAMGIEYTVTGLPEWEKKHESMAEGKSSEHARRMTIDELKEGLKYV